MRQEALSPQFPAPPVLQHLYRLHPLYRGWVLRQRLRQSCCRFEPRGGSGFKGSLLRADLIGRPVPVPFAQPTGVVENRERGQRQPQFLDRGGGQNPEELLLQCPDRPFGHAVALGLTNKGGRTGHAEEPDLALEIARQAIRAVVVAQDETLGHAAPLERAKVPGHPLSDRIRRLAPEAAWMPANSPEQGSTAT